MANENKSASFWIKDLYQNIVEHTCDPSALNIACINNKPDAPFDITPVYFKREVLSKYYNAPHKYSVRDGQINFIDEGFSIRVDTDMQEYVAVILVDLASLDYNEQCYWRSYNFQPDDKTTISKTAYRRWYEGQFEKPTAPDAILVQKYIKFYSDWATKFGWHLFTADPQDKTNSLYSLHLLSDENNEREFYEQVLNVTKLFIDSLNVKQFPQLDDENNKSLNRFSAYLQQNGIEATGLIDFLRKIQNLRSRGAAHPGTMKKNVIDYFGFEQHTYGFILGSIFATLVKVLETLEEISEVIIARNVKD